MYFDYDKSIYGHLNYIIWWCGDTPQTPSLREAVAGTPRPRRCAELLRGHPADPARCAELCGDTPPPIPLRSAAGFYSGGLRTY
jgi:hypothetical protein